MAAGLFLTFVARPLSVWICLRWFKVRLREQVFLSWAGLRGAVPIVLATIPLADGIENGYFFFDVVLVFVVVFTCLQAPTLPFLARRLGLTDEDAARDVEVEAAPAGPDRRRPAPGPGPGRLAAGGHRGERAAAAAEHGRLADHPQRLALQPGVRASGSRSATSC